MGYGSLDVGSGGGGDGRPPTRNPGVPLTPPQLNLLFLAAPFGIAPLREIEPDLGRLSRARLLRRSREGSYWRTREGERRVLIEIHA